MTLVSRRTLVGLVRLALVALVCAALALAYWLRTEGGVEWDPEAVQAWFSSVGPLAPLLFVTLVAFRPFLLIPSGALLFAAGVLFGTASGTLWATVGTTLGALLAFTLARVIGRSAVERRLSGAIDRVDSYLDRWGVAWVALLSALPGTPLTAVHSAAGLSRMGTASFLVGAIAGLGPRCALYSFFGDSLLKLDFQKIWIASALFIAALALSVLIRRRAAAAHAVPAQPVDEAGSRDETPPSPPDQGAAG